MSQRFNLEVPLELVGHVDRALKDAGLIVREYVKTGDYHLEVSVDYGAGVGVRWIPPSLRPKVDG